MKVEPRVRLLWHTPTPEKFIAVAARMCYSAMDVGQLCEKLEEAEIARMVDHILESRHVSVLRHVLFAFTLEGVSRSFSHQFVRHHVGVDVEQRSQHYRREKQFKYDVPPSVVGGSEEAKGLYEDHMRRSQETYDRLVECGIHMSEARQVLPNACETQLMVTMNLNALLNVIGQRACRVNTPEILRVALLMRREVVKVMPKAAPFLGPTCWSQGTCFEGEKKFKKVCNRPWKEAVLWSKDFPKKIRVVTPTGGDTIVRGAP